MDVNGNTVINLNPPLESTAVTSPSISGDLTKLYVVYRKGTENKIRTKYSTDGGVSWSYILPDLNTSSAPSSIECVFSKGNLHVTFLSWNNCLLQLLQHYYYPSKLAHTIHISFRNFFSFKSKNMSYGMQGVIIWFILHLMLVSSDEMEEVYCWRWDVIN